MKKLCACLFAVFVISLAIGTPRPPARAQNITPLTAIPVQVFSTKNLAANVSVTANTVTTVDSITVTMPSSGGPWRAFVNYDYYINTGGNGEFFLGDGTTSWCSVVHPAPAATWQTAQCSAWSKTTYANGAVITFTVSDFDTGGSTVNTTGGFTGARNSYMQVSVSASN